MPNLTRFRVDDDGCHRWAGYVTPNGYGSVWANGTMRRVHRVAYEQAWGPIPNGLDIDHRCHNKAAALGKCTGGRSCLHRRCINPDHLEATTNRVNAQRGLTGSYLASRDQCPASHPLDEANTYFAPGRRHRMCRICRLAASNRSRDANRDRVRARDRARRAIARSLRHG